MTAFSYGGVQDRRQFASGIAQRDYLSCLVNKHELYLIHDFKPASSYKWQHTGTLTTEQLQDVKEQRNRLIDLQSQSSQAMDKLVLVLAGGALTVSLAFIQPSANQHPANPATMPYLAIAWISLIASLFAQLISHFASQYAMMQTCEQIEQDYLGMPKQEWIPKGRIGRGYQRVSSGLSKCFAYRMTTHYLNIAAIIFCIAGISLLTWFVFLNFPQLPVPHTK